MPRSPRQAILDVLRPGQVTLTERSGSDTTAGCVARLSLPCENVRVTVQ